ncbi:MAG: 16S rRNA (cytidine(1402)-2'-O)-methyltransferase [Eubacteriales bacterium]
MTEGIKPAGTLYLCATPIGNLEDITLRVKRILQEVGLIAAEDTRHTRKLLSYYDIHTPLTSYHEHNKREKGQKLVEEIKQGKDIALVSDAGTPGISDPGQDLVALAVGEGIKVIPVPGATAAISALVSSGLPTDRFTFEGFLPRVKKDRGSMMAQLVSEERTVVFYESPHRLIKTLEEILELAGDRNIAVTRELTKAHEEVVRGKITAVLEHFQNNPLKGEITVVLQGRKDEKKELPVRSISDIGELVNDLILKGRDKKEAIKEVSRILGISKRDVYNAVLRLKD